MKPFRSLGQVGMLFLGVCLGQGCDSSAPPQRQPETTGLIAILEVTPDRITADGKATAKVEVEVRQAADATPVAGVSVELRSSRNTGEVIDLIEASTGLTDSVGKWSTMVKSSTPGEVILEVVGSEVEICKPKEETCQPVVATLTFAKEDVILPPAPCGTIALEGGLMQLTDSAVNSCYPQIVPADDGFALFYDEDDGGGMFFGDRRIFAAHYSAEGVLQGAASPVTVAGEDTNRPSVVAIDDGYAVVYQAKEGLVFQKVAADGTAGAPVPIAGTNYAQAVIARSDDRYGVVYTGRGTPEKKSTTWLVTLDEAGAVTAGPVDLLELADPELPEVNQEDCRTFPQVVSDGTDFGVAWQDRRGGSLDLYFRKVQADGTLAVDELVIRQDLESVSVAVKMVWTGAEYGLVFSDTREAYGHYQVFLARVKADGTAVIEEIQLTMGDTSSDAPGLAFWQGRYWVAWVNKPWNGDPEPFAPMPQSPVIDAGADVGLPYNGAAPDIGAIEFGSAWGGTYATLIYAAALDPSTGQLAGPLKVAENKGFSAFPVLQNVSGRMTLVWFDTENDLRNLFGMKLVCQQ